jgi:predicted DNA-binding protein
MLEDRSAWFIQMNVRLPDWLVSRIQAQARRAGQTSSADVRRALIQYFGEREGATNPDYPRED